MPQTSDVLASVLNLSRRTAVVDVGANPVGGEPPLQGNAGKGSLRCDLALSHSPMRWKSSKEKKGARAIFAVRRRRWADAYACTSAKSRA